MATELVAIKAARLYGERKPCGPDASAARYLGSEAGSQACDRAMETHRGFSYACEHRTTMARSSPSQGRAHLAEMVLNYISTKALGLPKSF